MQTGWLSFINCFSFSLRQTVGYDYGCLRRLQNAGSGPIDAAAGPDPKHPMGHTEIGSITS